MTQGQQPEAIRLADEYEHVGFVEKHRFAKEEWCRKAALELRRLNTENASLTTGYDAARLEIDSLKERAQELGQMARDCNSRRVIELQAKVRELEDMLAAVGAGGVEPLRKADHFRDATQMVPQGWKLVPVEPTLAMISAGRDTPLAGEADDDSPEDYRGVYRAMLAAAPEQRADHFRGATKMTLDEAIKHADEGAGCGAQCGVEHAQLAAWLRELRDRRVTAASSQPPVEEQGDAEDAATNSAI